MLHDEDEGLAEMAEDDEGLHEESDGGEDATRVEGVVHLLLCLVGHRRVNHHPPTGKKL